LNKKTFYIVAVIYVFLLFFCQSILADEPKTAKIVIIKSRDIVPYNDAVFAFIDKMQKKTDYLFLCIDKKENTKTLLSQIIKFNPDLIAAFGTSATRLAKLNYKTVPIVFSVVLNPLELKLIPEKREKDSNIAGVVLDIPIKTQVAWIKKVLPDVKNIGILYNSEKTANYIKRFSDYLKKTDPLFFLTTKHVSSIGDIVDNLKILNQKMDILIGVYDPFVYNQRTIRQILLFTLRNRVPFMGVSPQYVKAGALFSISADFKDQGIQAALLVQMILKGKKPAVIPLIYPNKIIFSINKNTAKRSNIKLSKEILKNAVSY
jgi:putative ABC transport system substrate-binding protein